MGPALDLSLTVTRDEEEENLVRMRALKPLLVADPFFNELRDLTRVFSARLLV